METSLLTLRSRAARCASVLASLLIVAVGHTAWAATMPAGSTVWMELRSNVCVTDCLGSNQPGLNPPNGIPLSTFTKSNGTHVTGFAEAFPDRVRSLLTANTGSFVWISMLDTYTVHGSAVGPFDITLHLAVSGTATSVVNGPFQQLVGANVNAEIGTFDSSTDPGFLEQFRVTPFDVNLTSATQVFASTSTTAASFSFPIYVATSHTRSTGVGDVFDIAYGVNSALAVGSLDLRNTALLSFDLPQGVYLTSALGGTFGTVPEPSTALLIGSGLLALGTARRRARSGPAPSASSSGRTSGNL